jgi:hypothetical protein
MSRDLRIMLAIMAGALIIGAPLIFAAPGPSTASYLAMVFHIVAPTPVPPTVTPVNTIVPTNTSVPTIGPTATPTLPPPSFNNCQADPNPNAAPHYPVRITNVNKVAETVTLRNTSTDTIDLSGWHMCSITGNQEHPISGTLASGASQTFSGPVGNIWNNSNPDPGALYNPNGQLVSYFNS